MGTDFKIGFQTRTCEKDYVSRRELTLKIGYQIRTGEKG